MKIAIVTDDGIDISQHFGKALNYSVFTVENGEVTGHERRPRTGLCGDDHDCDADHNCHGSGQGSCHSETCGMSTESPDIHTEMAAGIGDCQVVITRGMGYGACEALKEAGVEPIITDVETMDEALQLFLENKLVNLTDRLH